MTKEELRIEATTTVEWESTPIIDRPLFVHAYITGAEPREKQIAELKAYNEHLLNGDIEKHNKIVSLVIENRELKARVEKQRLQIDALEGQTPWKDIKDKSEVVEKLTKAKELLSFWVNDFYDGINNSIRYEERHKVLVETEQFLKEIENGQ